ncbi:MAG: Ig-like domain-containing protein, partial [Myxococcaceae bacterium]
DPAGNTLAAPHAVPFTTGAGADSTPPFVTAVLPAVNATGAGPDQSITLTFSEPMQKATVQSAFSITTPNAINGTFNWNGTNDTVTFVPSMRFPFSTDVGWKVSILAKDLAGNAVAAPISGAFRTRDCLMTGPILAHYNTLGGANSVVGNCRSDEQVAPDGNGKYNHFRAGSIYWSQATGAHEVHGEIRKKWAVLGWELSAIGYPTTDELIPPDGTGRLSHFQIGSIYWSPNTGAYEVRGLIRDLWASIGYERSALGYPTTDELDTFNKVGRYNHFQNGSIYFTPATGTHYIYGAIRTRYADQGYEKGRLGYPITNVYAVTGGLETQFQGGFIFWNTANGTTTVR